MLFPILAETPVLPHHPVTVSTVLESGSVAAEHWFLPAHGRRGRHPEPLELVDAGARQLTDDGDDLIQ
jgi:hypothetical protein